MQQIIWLYSELFWIDQTLMRFAEVELWVDRKKEKKKKKKKEIRKEKKKKKEASTMCLNGWNIYAIST